MSRPSSRMFLLGRMHSLAGILPLGLFLFEHLYSNATAMLGREAYDKQVGMLQTIPFVPVIEVLFIALPLLYHAGFGVYIGFISKNNAFRYSYTRNWLFVMQRISGLVTLVFILYHLWEFRFANLIFGTPINFDTVQTQLQNPAIFAFYVLGIISTTFHFSNGVWTALITWGITPGARGQRISSALRYVLFAMLSFVGVGTLISFV
ncbi:succinate dehydrogenase cytochrome b558 subunit [Effusibacillus lacus]|uniref:Succinate dehydrogenase n=1 Tax=Effusibacillus lacus TaxID=1348429 RepID=A0A292YMI6_9BACL|nr:succinate dehydrogenase cytochrome b558 subunit [Effusibacillus lacus]TCS71604.1 succinate dehydrogenase subunit C [Effusibacillus lacus]GAX90109.1 succinate dehydrogenase [Effusibacillus lacus]